MKLLYPFELLYQTVTVVKNLLYENRIFQKTNLDVPVISVGNLSFGGVGKTPCVLFIAQSLKKDFRISIVVKSYKAALKAPQAVDLKLPDAVRLFGDEACLLQQLLPECAVWAGPVKADTALACRESYPDLILIDDGFSHRRLGRDFDLVLIDSTQGLDGYMREPASSLLRADAVLITKSNLAKPESVKRLSYHIRERFSHLKDAVYSSDSVSEVPLAPGTPVYIFCGLARPDSFVTAVEKQGYLVKGKLIFSDHFQYTDEDEEKILQAYYQEKEKNQTLQMLTTLKDFVKLRSPKLREMVRVVNHKIVMSEADKEALIEKIRKSF